MKPFLLITGVVALAAACGCSSGKSESPVQAASAPAARAAPIADPCKLLTQAEAAEAIGMNVGPGETKRMGIITRCAFHDQAGQDLVIWLDVHNETAPVADPELFDSYTHLEVKPVSGIGEQALWAHNQIGTNLSILKGGRMVEVGLPREMATITPAVEQAAKLIASRM